jgi:ribonuclease HI
MVKFNVDGAVARNEDHGSISAIARDATGLFLGASTRTINDISHPATLEAMACAEALSLAEGLGITHIQVVSDCLEVIKALKEKNLSSYSSILFEISERCKLFQFVSFQHEGRESNGDAHVLARSAISQNFGRRLWLINPPYLVPLFAPK